jgi:hypothetical protein
VNVESVRRLSLVLILALPATTIGCRSEEPPQDVPDLLLGSVVDHDTGMGLSGVSVDVMINEREFEPRLGPHGTTRPRIREGAGAVTDSSGQFSVDLRGVKSELGLEYPQFTLTMGRLHLSKKGYETLFANYTGPGQKLMLKRIP